MANDDDIRSLVQLMRSVIEVQQNVNATLKSVGDKHDRVQTDIERLARQIGRSEENLTAKIARVENGQISFGADLRGAGNRLDAISKRLEDLEHSIDRSAAENREIRSDLIGQNNEILNAIQSGLIAKSDLDDAVERIEQIEHKLGM